MNNPNAGKFSARKIGLAALCGVGAGVLGGAAYLLLGGEFVFNIPLWASIVFYPGFIAGNWAHDHWHVSVGAAQVFGVAAVGLAYALIAVLGRFAWLCAKRSFNKNTL